MALDGSVVELTTFGREASASDHAAAAVSSGAAAAGAEDAAAAAGAAGGAAASGGALVPTPSEPPPAPDKGASRDALFRDLEALIGPEDTGKLRAFLEALAKPPDGNTGKAAPPLPALVLSADADKLHRKVREAPKTTRCVHFRARTRTRVNVFLERSLW